MIEIGQKFKNNSQNKTMTVVSIKNSKNVTAEFESGYIFTTTANNIRKGTVRDKLSPSILEIGFEGIGKYSYSNSSLFKGLWTGMLKRCYGNYENKFSSYIDCCVDPTWYNFQNFAAWCDQKYIKGYDLDKDLLGNGKFYSSKTCCFIPREINSNFRRKKTGDFSSEYTGIYLHKVSNKFCVEVNKKNHGFFSTIEEAKIKLQEIKREKFNYLAEKYKRSIDNEVYEKLIFLSKEYTE